MNVCEDQSNWDEWVPYATYVCNTTIHTATAYTPFELVYGFKSEVPSALRETPSPQYNYEDNVAELKRRLRSAHEIARQELITRKEKSKENYDKNTGAIEVNVGQKYYCMMKQ
jgi:hypothetical protein